MHLSSPGGSRDMMKTRVAVAVCWVLFSVLAAEAEGNAQVCMRFRDLKMMHGESKTYWCPAVCDEKGEVFGTNVYLGKSDICLAALHAGVITNLGVEVNVTCLPDKVKHVCGTAKNRIVSISNNKEKSFRAYKVESTVEVEGMVEEVLMVHNGGSDDHLRFACLAQNNMSSITSTKLKSWNYNSVKFSELMDDGSSRVRFEMSMKANSHAVRILGSHRDEDVLAVVQYPDAEYQSKVATVRGSVGEKVTIDFKKNPESLNNNILFKQLPNDWTSSPTINLTFNLQPAHAGIYIVHSSSDNGNIKGAYFDLVVRECKVGFFGIGCSRSCPQCKNGGQCHSRRGTCLCPPGFIGDTCQFACQPGWFGNKCQFRCDKKTIGFLGTVNKDVQQEGSCVGLTICLPPPYSCSCAAGFTHPTTNPAPTCTQKCYKGHFGADCSQQCHNCIEDDCNPFSGTCRQGCKSGNDCRQVPSLTEFNITGQQRGYKANWKASDNDARYFLSYQFLGYNGCTPDTTKDPQQNLNVTLVAPIYHASNLSPYASYNVCIVTSSSGGLSSPNCSKVQTLSEVPTVKITVVECKEIQGSKLECSADVDGGCERYNGPGINITFTLRTELPCSHNLTNLQRFVELKSTKAVVNFPQYLAGVKYEVTAEVGNDAGTGDKFNTSFSTNSKTPPPVQDVTHTILSDTALQLLWNDPCPSNGKIISIYMENKYLSVERCATTNQFDRCYNITGLTLGEKKTFIIEEKTRANGWTQTKYEVIFEREPHPPEVIKFTPGDRQIDLTLKLHKNHVGTLKNCSIILTRSEGSCTIHLTHEDSPLNCNIRDLEDGKTYEAKAKCCNTLFCSKEKQKQVATKLSPPKFTGSFGILRRTKSSITIHLPTTNHNTDGNSSLIVFVQAEVQNDILDQEAVIKMYLNKPYRPTRRKRNTIEREDQCQKQEWIAAEIKQDEKEFMVGDGKIYNGFLNCPLNTRQTYSIGIMGVYELLGLKSYSEFVMKKGVAPKPSPANLLLFLLLLLLVLPVLGLLTYFRLLNQSTRDEWKAKFKTGVSQEVLAQPDESSTVSTNHRPENGNMTNNLPHPRKQHQEPNETIYENLRPDESLAASHVPFAKVEAYLNKLIGSKEAGNDFRTVPFTLSKSMKVAQHPENKAKNRFKNNHPYDDTRVVLTCADEDPTSDYINANHVQGYGNMRYIASQGPKDAKVSTIADFWRMVVEQNINVIIMVANFVEMGKKKVGEYFTPGKTLNFDGYEVMVTNTEQLPHFTLSSLLVRLGEQTYKVQHYHYIKWPDHGIPTEAKSIAQMLNHFQSHHTKGGTVVHCSAGIGRTGTVLQVLLMCEMLRLKNYLNSIEVLGRLRKSRSRLVENEAQYNLSLEILEEILFGEEAIVSTDDILNHLDKYLSTSRIQFARAKALPSPLSFTTSNLPVFQPFNRNQSVLPADSNRCYLQARTGVDAWLSQYINAIRVPGLNRDEYMLATEHPLPHTISSFWRLVVETGCTVVILVNSLEDHDVNAFPMMIMEPGKMWHVDNYKMQVEQTLPYGTWLQHSSLTISSNEDWTHRVDVYQSVKWPVYSPLPPSPYILLTFAELLQIPRSPTSGPPLLCCSDGVTGCGLVAAMTLVIEYLQREQMINVYRTVVKLLRARQQFIISEDQFSMLYTSAAIYLQEYSSYGNFQ